MQVRREIRLSGRVHNDVSVPWKIKDTYIRTLIVTACSSVRAQTYVGMLSEYHVRLEAGY